MGKYVVIGGGPRSGKTIAVTRAAVQRSIETGMPVAVISEFAKQRILDEAARQGVQIPEPVIVKPYTKPERGITFAGVIVDYIF